MKNHSNDSPYASSKDSESVVSKATPMEQWLENELDKIDPNRHEIGSAGETGALRKLVVSLKERLDGGAK